MAEGFENIFEYKNYHIYYILYMCPVVLLAIQQEPQIWQAHEN